MKKYLRRGIVFVTVLSLSLGLSGCGDSQKQAWKTVKAKGYEASVEGFLDAAAAGDLQGLELFRAAGVDVDASGSSGNTALIRAAAAGRKTAVERLLGMGADPRKINGFGRDALISASAKGFDEVARLLMGRGADISLRDSEGWSALSIAAYNGHNSVVALLAAGSTSSELDDALLVASFSGDPSVIDTLLGQGANINVRSPEGKTPLMIASAAGKMDTVRVLLQNHANLYAVDPDNRTATHLADAAGHAEISKLIADPASWGRSEQGERIAGEMEKARIALASEGVEEDLLAGRPLAGEAKRGGTAATPASAKEGSRGSGAEAGSTGPQTQTATAGTATAATASADQGPVDSASPSRRSNRLERSRRVREGAKDKPIVALNGSTLHSRRPEEAPVKGMVLAAYHEESLPLLVDGVKGSTASVRRLDQSEGSVQVEEGAMVPGTPYRVVEVTPLFVSSKEGKGRMVDVSRVELENTKSGATHLLVKDVSGQTGDNYAMLTSADSQYRYVVKAGDVFRTTQPEAGAKDYQVLDIRPNAVVIKDLATEEVTTVARDGVIDFKQP